MLLIFLKTIIADNYYKITCHTKIWRSILNWKKFLKMKRYFTIYYLNRILSCLSLGIQIIFMISGESSISEFCNLDLSLLEEIKDVLHFLRNYFRNFNFESNKGNSPHNYSSDSKKVKRKANAMQLKKKLD